MLKKAKELIKKAISELSATNVGIFHTQSTLEETLNELSESDWVSVKDRLPEYNEEVYVRAISNRGLVYLKLSRTDLSKVPDLQKKYYDKSGFLMIKESAGCHVTHWKLIEKFEE